MARLFSSYSKTVGKKQGIVPHPLRMEAGYSSPAYPGTIPGRGMSLRWLWARRAISRRAGRRDNREPDPLPRSSPTPYLVGLFHVIAGPVQKSMDAEDCADQRSRIDGSQPVPCRGHDGRQVIEFTKNYMNLSDNHAVRWESEVRRRYEKHEKKERRLFPLSPGNIHHVCISRSSESVSPR